MAPISITGASLSQQMLGAITAPERDAHLEEVDSKRPAKNAIGHGCQEMLVNAASDIHEQADPAVETLPELRHEAFLAR